jgi:hypothetical protein
MKQDIQETKKRLLEAATNEFAQRGIAGARVDKMAVIEQAQRDGRVSDRWSPAELLTLIVGMSTIWFFATPEASKLNATEISAQRRTITEAIQLLVDGSKSRGREP